MEEIIWNEKIQNVVLRRVKEVGIILKKNYRKIIDASLINMFLF